MPKSMASSDPLSSPSPSPPPPSNLPSRSGLTSAHTTSNKSATQQLDTSSELSELTDDDVDGDKVTHHSEDEDDGLDQPKGDASTRPTPKRSRRQAPEPKWGDWTYKRKRRKQLTVQVGDIEDDPEEEEEEEEEEEQPALQPHPMEEEEDEEEQPGIRRPVNAVRTPRPRDAANDDVEEEEEERDDGDDDDDDVTPRRRRRVARAGSLSDSGLDEEGDSEAGQDPEDDVLPLATAALTATVKEATPDLTDDEDDPATLEVEADDAESENETASEEEDPEAEEGAMDVDEDAPEPPTPSINGVSVTVPVPIPAAPSTQVVASIMGAAVVDDVPTPSASPSPPPEDAPDADVPEPEDVEAEDAEVEDEAADAETEADLQHEHRAEALDALATIELKFALLRERVYVEKMEALAWEEALVENGASHATTSDLSACPLIFSPYIRLGTHPESLHLHSELSRRRDKRMELAARRRNYEVANVLKRRRAEENSVWSWWMVRISSVRPLALC
jgi:hypothetical protein